MGERSEKIGLTRLEISAPWNELEPEPGKIRPFLHEKRVAIAKQLGLGTRIRINSFWAGAMPAWSQADKWSDATQKPIQGFVIPSISDERFWEHYGPMCTAIARRFRGEDIYYNSFIGMHAELKYGDWWTYDPSSLKRWRDAIHATPRPTWLIRVVGDAELPDFPPVPKPTRGVPDNSPVEQGVYRVSRADLWRDASSAGSTLRFMPATQRRISAPLGESYRRESAKFSNLDYWGLSRGCEQIVHSYDFFWHQSTIPGCSSDDGCVSGHHRIENIAFEFDGPDLCRKTFTTDESRSSASPMRPCAKVPGSRWRIIRDSPQLPSTWPILARIGGSLLAASSGWSSRSVEHDPAFCQQMGELLLPRDEERMAARCAIRRMADAHDHGDEKYGSSAKTISTKTYRLSRVVCRVLSAGADAPGGSEAVEDMVRGAAVRGGGGINSAAVDRRREAIAEKRPDIQHDGRRPAGRGGGRVAESGTGAGDIGLSAGVCVAQWERAGIAGGCAEMGVGTGRAMMSKSGALDGRSALNTVQRKNLMRPRSHVADDVALVGGGRDRALRSHPLRGSLTWSARAPR